MTWRRLLNTIFTIIYFSFLSLVCFFAIIGLLSRNKESSPIRFFSVVSGSMSPSIPVGSAILVAHAHEYFVNDVITYSLGKNLVTHRVVYAGSYYLTKGDANKDLDLGQVVRSQVIGKVVFTIPFLGHVQELTKTLPGLILLVYLPSFVILVAESRIVISEFKKVGMKSTDTPLRIMIIFVGIFLAGNATYSYFSERTLAFTGSVSTGALPTASPSSIPSPSPLVSPSPTAQPTQSPQPSPTASASATPYVTPFPCPTGGAVNCGNLEGSVNSSTINNSSTNTVNQTNVNNVTNTVTVYTDSGNNSASGNSSTSITTKTGNTLLIIETNTSSGNNVSE